MRLRDLERANGQREYDWPKEFLNSYGERQNLRAKCGLPAAFPPPGTAPPQVEAQMDDEARPVYHRDSFVPRESEHAHWLVDVRREDKHPFGS